MMRKLISCAYHEDSQTVELLYTDGTLIDIDCMAVEDEVARNMYERSELDYLLNHDPAGYADLILNGDVEAYLRNVTDYRPLDENPWQGGPPTRTSILLAFPTSEINMNVHPSAQLYCILKGWEGAGKPQPMPSFFLLRALSLLQLLLPACPTITVFLDPT